MPSPRPTVRRSRRNAAWPERGLAVALVGGGALLGWWLPHTEHSRQLGGLSYDPATAHATLGAIAAGVITLTGFVLTAVTLVVQSVQAMSPRPVGVLGHFERSLVLFGALTGTAVHALVVLAQVREDHVPKLSVTLAIVFVVLSTGAILRSLTALREMVTGGGLVRVVAHLVHAALEQERRDAEPPPESPEPSPAPPEPAAPPRAAGHQVGRADAADVLAPDGGIVQYVDGHALAALAARLDAHVTCEVAVGSPVHPGVPLLRVTGAVTAEDARLLTRAVHVGPARRVDHDPVYGVRLLVDIAVRALSPAVNAPTTAVQALDQIESVLLRLARHPLGPVVVHDQEHIPRVTVPRPAPTGRPCSSSPSPRSSSTQPTRSGSTAGCALSSARWAVSRPRTAPRHCTASTSRSTTPPAPGSPRTSAPSP
ncbi:DUF2254 family protein [Streptomyces sp. NPDC002644]